MLAPYLTLSDSLDIVWALIHLGLLLGPQVLCSEARSRLRPTVIWIRIRTVKFNLSINTDLCPKYLNTPLKIMITLSQPTLTLRPVPS